VTNRSARSGHGGEKIIDFRDKERRKGKRSSHKDGVKNIRMKLRRAGTAPRKDFDLGTTKIRKRKGKIKYPANSYLFDPIFLTEA